MLREKVTWSCVCSIALLLVAGHQMILGAALLSRDEQRPGLLLQELRSSQQGALSAPSSVQQLQELQGLLRQLTSAGPDGTAQFSSSDVVNNSLAPFMEAIQRWETLAMMLQAPLVVQEVFVLIQDPLQPNDVVALENMGVAGEGMTPAAWPTGIQQAFENAAKVMDHSMIASGSIGMGGAGQPTSSEALSKVSDISVTQEQGAEAVVSTIDSKQLSEVVKRVAADDGLGEHRLQAAVNASCNR